MQPETLKILIWGKTYPEISKSHGETVCTGGCLDDGSPIRLYPVPLRYLNDLQQYSLYDWIEVPVALSQKDQRPESRRVVGAIKVVGEASTDSDWDQRRAIIFANRNWHYDCLNELKKSERLNRTSLGFIEVDRVEKIWIKQRPPAEMIAHQRKRDFVVSQKLLFEGNPKFLTIPDSRIHITWRCRPLNNKPNNCPGHSAGILDWGLGELGRRDGMEAARAKMESLSDTSKIELGLYVGNFKAYPHNFGIIGLWFPKRSQQLRLI